MIVPLLEKAHRISRAGRTPSVCCMYTHRVLNVARHALRRSLVFVVVVFCVFFYVFQSAMWLEFAQRVVLFFHRLPVMGPSGNDQQYSGILYMYYPRGKKSLLEDIYDGWVER